MTEQTIPGGKFHPLIANNPASVCTEAALLATALLTVGVPEHPRIRFSIETEGTATRWRWLFAEKSKCGTYATADLIKWWHDEAWQAANPNHEWAIVRRVLTNHAIHAKTIRDTIPRIVLHHGKSSLYLPANATPEYRNFLIDQLEGRISSDEEFTGEKTVPNQ
jgi:hypothetical protein